MGLYEKFAAVYQQGPYLRFSQNLAESVFPQYLKELDIHPSALLDVACGEGSFGIAMSKLGCHVTGVDQSQQMIDLAKHQAQEESQNVRFLVADMCSMNFEDEFDLVTCFFDSLNYLLKIKELYQTFQNIYRALRPGGFFIFDMNTIYGLAVEWMQQKSCIQNQTEDFLEFHKHSFDYENLIATVEITVFMKQGSLWERFIEIHRERGYPIADLQFLLKEAGFEVLGVNGHLSQHSELFNTSPRVWFTAKKP